MHEAMQASGFLSGLLLSLSMAVLGCGGGDKPAESADAKAEEAKPETADSGDESKAEGDDKAEADKGEDKKADDKKADDKKAAAPADDGPKPTRTPDDILKAPDTVFLFSFNDSEPKQAAEEKCDKKHADNPKKKNECMAGERKKFPAEGHRFKKDDKGDQWWWITVHQTGNKLIEIHKIPIEFGEVTATSVTLKSVGKDKGKKPFANPPAKVVFEVPNDYQIAIKDPKHGRLVFQAKVGSLTE
jgi:hypothetical protein